VIGLLCAALGRPRDASLEDFLPMRMAVRVDREGRLMRDYHTAQNVLRASGKNTQDTVLSERFYLADANFLVGLSGEVPFVNQLVQALVAPVWPMFLGRKSFVSSMPVGEAVVAEDIYREDGQLADWFTSYPWRKPHRNHRPPDKLHYILETAYGQGEPRPDVPLTFVSKNRAFAIRHVRTQIHPLPPESVLELEGR